MRFNAKHMTTIRAHTTLTLMIPTAPNHHNLIPLARRKIKWVRKYFQSLWSKPAREVPENVLRMVRISRVGMTWGWKPQVASPLYWRIDIMVLEVSRPLRPTKSSGIGWWTKVSTQRWHTILTQPHTTTTTRASTADRIPLTTTLKICRVIISNTDATRARSKWTTYHSGFLRVQRWKL